MISYWWIYSFIVALLCLYKFVSRNVNFWKEKGVDGPRPLPFFGNTLDKFTTSITELELRRFFKYGKVYGSLELMQPILTVSDVELIKQITMRDFHCFTNHAMMASDDPLLNKMLVNLCNDEWKRVRNIFIPAFTTNRIRQMFPLLNKCVDNALEYFDELAVIKKPFDIHKTLGAFVMDVIAHTVFGVKVNSFKDPDGDYFRHASNLYPTSNLCVLFGLMMPNSLRSLLGFSGFSQSSCNYFKSLLKHIISERRAKKLDNKDLLQILLDAEINDVNSLADLNNEGLGNTAVLNVKHGKRKLDDNEILAQCMHMVLAGTDMSSLALTYFIFKLASRRDVQDKLYLEVKHYFEHDKYEYDTLMSLPYLDAVLNEILRYYTPMVQFNRVANCDYKFDDIGITIPQGTIINIPFHVIHHDPDYWSQPSEFKPERFLPENKSEIVPFSFAAFGYGPRICLGMKLAIAEVKALIANVVYRFEILKTDRTPIEPIYNGKLLTNRCEPIFAMLKRRCV